MALPSSHALSYGSTVVQTRQQQTAVRRHFRQASAAINPFRLRSSALPATSYPPTEAPRNVTLRVLVSEDEKRRLDRLARERGVPVAQIVRSALPLAPASSPGLFAEPVSVVVTHGEADAA